MSGNLGPDHRHSQYVKVKDRQNRSWLGTYTGTHYFLIKDTPSVHYSQRVRYTKQEVIAIRYHVFGVIHLFTFLYCIFCRRSVS